MRPPPSSAESPVTGKCGFCYFPDRFLRQTCVYVYMYIIFVVLVVVCIVLCRKEKEGVETRVVME